MTREQRERINRLDRNPNADRVRWIMVGILALITGLMLVATSGCGKKKPATEENCKTEKTTQTK